MYQNTNRENLKLAFDLAESYFKVPKLLDPEDIDSDVVDERSIMTYLSSLYVSLPRVKCSETIKEIKNCFHEYSTEIYAINKWIDEKIEFFESNSQLPYELIDLRTQIDDLKCFFQLDFKTNEQELTRLKSIIFEHKNKQSGSSNEKYSYQELLNKWEVLKALIEKKKFQLETASLKFETTKKNFIKINHEIDILENSLQEIDSIVSKVIFF